MNPQELQEKLVEFERGRGQLSMLSSQKQQLETQREMLGESSKELEKSTEKKVFKAMGALLIQKETADVKKELNDQVESIELRLKSVAKQESTLVEKLNKLRVEIESSAGKEANKEA